MRRLFARWPLLAVALLLAAAASATPFVSSGVVRADGGGPVAEWTFDEGSGTTAHDSVGGLDGTLSGGATWAADGPEGGGAISFDGVDGGVSIPDAATLDPTGAFTVATWARTSGNPPLTFEPIIAKGDLGCDLGASWEIDASSPPSFRGAVALTNMHGSLIADGSGPWFDGNWHLITYVVDPVNLISTTYVDGHARSQTWLGPDSVLYGGPTLVSSDLRLGATSPNCQYRKPFQGELDDLRIWDRALSQDEITAMLPTNPTTTELKLWKTSNTTEDAMIDSAYADESLTYRVHVTPWPAAPGDIVWYRSDNGAPEVPFATTPLRVVDMTGYQFYEQAPGSLSPGTYTIRAAWQGAGNSLPSSSAAFPLTITKRPVTAEFTANPTSTWPGAPTTLTARLAVENPPTTYRITGNVDFYDVTNGANDLIGSAPLAYVGNPTWNQAVLNISSLSAGAHTIEARWAGTSTIAATTLSAVVTAEKQWSAAFVEFATNPTLNTSGATAHVWFTTGGPTGSLSNPPVPTGTLTLREQGSGTVIGQQNVTANGYYDFQLPKYAVGTKTFIATYSGDANFDPATSAPVTLTIAADVVDATGVGVQYSTFYPYKDDYLDTDAIRGTRNEPATVSIRVLSPTGALVRSASFGLAQGSYTYAWNGRTSSGAILASGTYKVVQLLTDAAGTKKTVTSSVVLSPKRLYYSTVTYTKRAKDQYAKRTSSWVAWSFTLPSATVYKSLVFSVYGRTSVWASGMTPSGFGPQDFKRCGSWSPSCVTRYGTLPFSYGWVKVYGNTASDRSGRAVNLYAWAGYGASASIVYGRVTVTYGVLR
jgi:hypothetical protein